MKKFKLSKAQKKELDIRLEEHRKNPKSGVDAFEFLDQLDQKLGFDSTNSSNP